MCGVVWCGAGAVLCSAALSLVPRCHTCTCITFCAAVASTGFNSVIITPILYILGGRLSGAGMLHCIKDFKQKDVGLNAVTTMRSYQVTLPMSWLTHGILCPSVVAKYV